jgi:hypothetical protein
MLVSAGTLYPTSNSLGHSGDQAEGVTAVCEWSSRSRRPPATKAGGSYSDFLPSTLEMIWRREFTTTQKTVDTIFA